MIFKLQHTHQPKPQQSTQQINKPKQIIPNEYCPQFLLNLLKQSEYQLDKKSKNQINQSVLHRQKKVYETLLPDNVPNYLGVMFQKANASQQSYIKQLMGKRQDSIMDKIYKQQLSVKQGQDNDKKIKRIKNQLDQKLKYMKQQFTNLNISKIDQYINNHNENKQFSQQQLSKINKNKSLIVQDFKQKQYWKNQSFNSQHKRIKSFISKMKKQKSQLQNKYNTDLQNTFKKLLSHQQSQKLKLSERKHQLYLQNLQKQYKLKSIQRKQYNERKQSQIIQIQNFLNNINNKQPIHLKYQKDFKDFIAKQDQHKQKVLQQLKQKHPTYSPQQVQEHIQKYMQVKQKYNQEKQLKAVMQQQILSKRYQQLRQLYRSKHHKSIIQPRKSLLIEHQQLSKNRQKIKQYANTVKQSFKPLVSKRKQKQLVNNIKLLELSQYPTKKKVIKQNGIIQFQDKPQYDAYEKGVSYLQQLRSINDTNRSRMTTSKRYQQRSNSALELTSPKKIDYLRESRPSIDLKPTISDWKDLLVKKDFTQRDKLQRVLDRAQSLQIHAKQKQVQLRNMKRQSSQSMHVKQQSDKYYLQSIAARMVLLKDVVMK